MAPTVAYGLAGDVPPANLGDVPSSPSRAVSAVRVFGLALVVLAAARAGWDVSAGLPQEDNSFGVVTTPLLEVSRGSVEAGFTELSAITLGLSFSNTVPNRLLMDNNNFMNGSGVAAGDFDRDGWCDLYLCSLGGPNALYRNLGGWRFEEVAAQTGVACSGVPCTGAVFADLEGDGDLDLLVSSLGRGVLCYRNEDGRRFVEVTDEAGLASTAGSTTMALADVDGDGDLDLYVANYGALSLLRSGGRAEMKQVNGQWVFTGPHAQRLRIVDGRLQELGELDVLYRNDGQGRFQAVGWGSDAFLDEEGRPMTPPLDHGLTAQFRDVDLDGDPDLYVCNDFDSPDRFWINDGQGRFRAIAPLALRKQSFSSMGADFTDLDRDGHLDFLVVEMLGRRHFHRLSQMTTAPIPALVPGRVDDRPNAARNTLFWNRGDRTYAEVAHWSGVAATDWSWQPLFLDVDLDGWEDLLVVNGFPHDVQDRDTLDRIRALGQQTVEQSRTNLLLYPPFLTPNVAYRNERRNLQFKEMSAAWGFASVKICQGTVLADLDNDGDLDVVANCFNSAPLVCRNDTVAPRLAVRLRGLGGNPYGVGALIQVDATPLPRQRQEVLAGGRYLSGDDTLRAFATGGGTAPCTIEVRWRSGRRSRIQNAQAGRLYIVDEKTATPLADAVAPPRRPHFEDVSGERAYLHRDQPYPDYARQPLLMKQLSQLGPGVTWWDLDGNGADDLVQGGGRGGFLAVFRNLGRGRLTVWRHPAYERVVDSDQTTVLPTPESDGKSSLLVGSANYEEGASAKASVVRYSLESGQSEDVVPGFPDSIGPLAMADYDGDGDLDLFVGGRVLPGRYPAAASSRLFQQQDGRWALDEVNSRVLGAVGLVSAAVWSDLDGDGWAELGLACEWGPLRVYDNREGKLVDATASWGLAETSGWWNSLAAGDLDGDGRLDLVAGNWGLNTGYSASPEHPARLLYGDLTGLGTVDLLEATFDSGLKTYVPRRNLAALSRALPVLLETFPTHRSFAKASLGDVVQSLPGQLQDLHASTLNSMVFLNRSGHFEGLSLPWPVQLSPVFGLNIADMDGDGAEDVFVGQNFFGVRPDSSRLDGGVSLWLKGDGVGGLTAVPPAESGIAVYGEVRGAALADFDADGRVDVAVAQNAAALKLYRNQGAQPGFRIRLNAGPLNPYGVGAVIRLKRGDRLGPAREVHAGSGYWSCDSPVQVMTLGDGSLADSVWVRWPGGEETVNLIPSGATEVSVSAPL